jgi:predicted DNA-binding protein
MKREELQQEGRKARKDKKRDVNPVISIELYDCIARLSYITSRPIKVIGELICQTGVESDSVIEILSPHFRRSFWLNDHINFPGRKNQFPIKVDRGEGDRKRISLRFSQEFHERIGELAYALDLPVATAVTLLLETSIRYTTVVHDCIETYVEKNLDEKRLAQLKKIIEYIDQCDPTGEKMTISKLLIGKLAKDFMNSAKNIKEVLNKWIDDITV